MKTKMRKIYNKIVIEWNEATQHYDKVLYEDSFMYGGEIEEAMPSCVGGAQDCSNIIPHWQVCDEVYGDYGCGVMDDEGGAFDCGGSFNCSQLPQELCTGTGYFPGCSWDNVTYGEAPANVGFTAEQISGFTPLNVNFINHTISDIVDDGAGGQISNIIGIHWDFGDGGTSNQSPGATQAGHNYEQAGTFTVTLSVTWLASYNNEQIITETKTDYITVYADVTDGHTVNIDAAGTYDWDFGANGCGPGTGGPSPCPTCPISDPIYDWLMSDESYPPTGGTCPTTYNVCAALDCLRFVWTYESCSGQCNEVNAELPGFTQYGGNQLTLIAPFVPYSGTATLNFQLDVKDPEGASSPQSFHVSISGENHQELIVLTATAGTSSGAATGAAPTVSLGSIIESDVVTISAALDTSNLLHDYHTWGGDLLPCQSPPGSMDEYWSITGTWENASGEPPTIGIADKTALTTSLTGIGNPTSGYDIDQTMIDGNGNANYTVSFMGTDLYGGDQACVNAPSFQHNCFQWENQNPGTGTACLANDQYGSVPAYCSSQGQGIMAMCLPVYNECADIPVWACQSPTPPGCNLTGGTLCDGVPIGGSITFNVIPDLAPRLWPGAPDGAGWDCNGSTQSDPVRPGESTHCELIMFDEDCHWGGGFGTGAPCQACNPDGSNTPCLSYYTTSTSSTDGFTWSSSALIWGTPYDGVDEGYPVPGFAMVTGNPTPVCSPGWQQSTSCPGSNTYCNDVTATTYVWDQWHEDYSTAERIFYTMCPPQFDVSALNLTVAEDTTLEHEVHFWTKRANGTANITWTIGELSVEGFVVELGTATTHVSGNKRWKKMLSITPPLDFNTQDTGPVTGMLTVHDTDLQANASSYEDELPISITVTPVQDTDRDPEILSELHATNVVLEGVDQFNGNDNIFPGDLAANTAVIAMDEGSTLLGGWFGVYSGNDEDVISAHLSTTAPADSVQFRTGAGGMQSADNPFNCPMSELGIGADSAHHFKCEFQIHMGNNYDENYFVNVEATSQYTVLNPPQNDTKAFQVDTNPVNTPPIIQISVTSSVTGNGGGNGSGMNEGGPTRPRGSGGGGSN